MKSLPESLRNYLEHTSATGSQPVKQVYLEQKGLFNINGKRWVRMKARQWVDLEKHEFTWKAKAGFFRVTDHYMDGKGKLTPRLFGLIKLGEATGPEMDEGEAQRFLTELIWYPAFACSPSIAWEAAGENTCRATLADRHGLRVSALFHFNDQFLLEGITAKRYREVSGSFDLNDWEISHLEYKTFNGILIPYKAHVTWKLPEKDLCYYKLEVTKLEYA